MLERALPLRLLLNFPAVVVSQTPSLAPKRAAPSKQVAPIPAPAEKQRQFEEELQRHIASRDALTKEIQRLRKTTGRHQQVIVSVKVCELSLNKARNADFNVEGVDSKWLHTNGFSGALSAGAFDEPGQSEDARRVKSGSEALYARVVERVIENDEALKKIVAELEKADALKVLAEPTLETVSGRPISFHAGGEFPIPVPQSNGGSTIEFREFGTRLDLVPVVLGHGRVRLELRPRISEIDSDRSVVLGEFTVPGLRVREVDTAVEMSVGQTLVLAGLVQQRVIHKAREESGEASNDKSPGVVAKENSEDTTDPSQDEIEETELIIIVRVEILDAPKLARRSAVE